VFITLEDETGNVNVIVGPSLVEQQRREVMGARLLAVYGQWQSKNGVRHMVAKES
jgi:error-prone DNA polymerase